MAESVVVDKEDDLYLTMLYSKSLRKSTDLSKSPFSVYRMGAESCYRASHSPCTFLSIAGSVITDYPQMHRARVFNQISLEYDWYHPRVRFVRVPRTHVRFLGQFEKISKRLVALAAKNTSCPLDVEDTAFIYMPVHELQVENIKARFGNVELLDPEISLPAQAQASIRYGYLFNSPHTLKLLLPYQDCRDN